VPRPAGRSNSRTIPLTTTNSGAQPARPAGAIATQYDNQTGDESDYREQVLQSEKHVCEWINGLDRVVAGKESQRQTILVKGHPEKYYHKED